MKNIIIISIIISLLLAGCGAETVREDVYTSSVSWEDCWLCGGGGDEQLCWGQNNIGIISLNTFEVMPIEINRYDLDGTLIEENAGYMAMQTFKNQENGFYAYAAVNPDRGYARISIEFNEDKEVSIEKAASFLCEDCLKTVSESGFGIGVISLDTRKICVLNEHIAGFGLGGYYVSVDCGEQDKADILAFYCPLRY